MSQQGQPPQMRHDEQDFIESRIAELSIRFISLPADQVDQTIVDALRLACEWFDLDLGTVWQRGSNDPRPRTLTHYYSPIVPAPPGNVDPVTDDPWSLQAAMAGNVSLVESLDPLPPEAARDRDTGARCGLRVQDLTPAMKR